ncbi:MAG: phenylalanine--tRNA ligase subunit alpha [Acidobacteria bacterium]|nr:phenylalanine--tRNA ligase subunit alpha [Acidobacteriota bacterium]
MDFTNWNLEQALDSFQQKLAACDDHESWQALRLSYLGKKQGLITGMLLAMRDLPKERKPLVGKQVNQLKQAVEQALKDSPHAEARSLRKSSLDVTLPGIRPKCGTLHPLTITRHRLIDFFRSYGYDVGEGPEIETTYYNFEALNTPESHPAREEADTFYIDDDRLLRTQTSGVQIRYMESHQPPLRMIAPGKVFRRDDDITHSPMFHQLEGLVVGPDITFGHLKGMLQAFARHLFGPNTVIRLRPSFFPFTEPSAEMDVSCPFCESGCRVCKQTRWIEILGCGMVDPNVFEHVGYDPEAVSGFAFGMGIERIAMLSLGIPDIRLFYQNDRRFLDQFRGA